jgi:hypothetical protein
MFLYLPQRPFVFASSAPLTQRSDSDPYDKTSPAITVGPHWMIMWPFDPKTTDFADDHKPGGRVHHAGWVTLRAFARHGTTVNNVRRMTGLLFLLSRGG